MNERIYSTYNRVKPYTTEISFIAGFIFDLITLGRIDDGLNIFTQGLYLTIAVTFYLLQFFPHNFSKLKGLDKIIKYESEIFHFLIGSLLSAFTIFYFKSASLSHSFIFLALLVIILFINEMDQFKQFGQAFRGILLSLCVVSFTTYLIPTMLGNISTALFVISIALCFVLYGAIYYVVRDAQDHDIQMEVTFPWIGTLLLFSLLYFSKVTPPVPLALKEAGVFYDLKKDNGHYLLKKEKSFFNFMSFGESEINMANTKKVYAYTSIFAPKQFKDTVYTYWYRKIDNGNWAMSDKIPLNLKGGRGNGFRGYTYKSKIVPGKWRIIVKTGNDLEIGRINFKVVNETQSETLWVSIKR